MSKPGLMVYLSEAEGGRERCSNGEDIRIYEYPGMGLRKRGNRNTLAFGT